MLWNYSDVNNGSHIVNTETADDLSPVSPAQEQEFYWSQLLSKILTIELLPDDSEIYRSWNYFHMDRPKYCNY